MRKTMTMVLLAITMLTACAMQTRAWQKGGGTPEMFGRDRSECQYDVAKATANIDPAGYISKADRENELMALCLRSRGWELVSQQ